jgi:gas vesicle protein
LVRHENGGEPAVVIERSGGVGVFLFGIAVGAGLALMFAPQTGDETREAVVRGARKVKRKARRFADSARDAAEETREALERKLSRLGGDHDAEYDGEDDGV